MPPSAESPSPLILPGQAVTDLHGRRVSYLRVSVTDRCNLRCAYCRGGPFSFLPHDSILRYEELLGFIRVGTALGVEKVRLTGGEPFVRKGFLNFLGQVGELTGAGGEPLDVRVTTNATLLPGKARELARLGLRKVNISLDTLDRERFREITGRDFFPQVRRAIDECLDAGLSVKINAVAMRGVNDDELPAFLKLARDNPLDVRFIEFMPMGQSSLWDAMRFWPAEELLAAAGREAELIPEAEGGAIRSQKSRRSSGPARMFRIAGGQGRLGIISPLSDHFCGSCNRLRLTCDGRLRTCLFSPREYNLRAFLRSGRFGPEKLAEVVKKAASRKPIGRELLEARSGAPLPDKCGGGAASASGAHPGERPNVREVQGRAMSAIGG